MTTTLPPPAPLAGHIEDLARRGGGVLPEVDWADYADLLRDFEGRPASPRLTYERGVLEVMSPLLPAHEKPNRLLALLVEVLAEE